MLVTICCLMRLQLLGAVHGSGISSEIGSARTCAFDVAEVGHRPMNLGDLPAPVCTQLLCPLLMASPDSDAIVLLHRYPYQVVQNACDCNDIIGD
jgi:hypothetical protein